MRPGLATSVSLDIAIHLSEPQSPHLSKKKIITPDLSTLRGSF